LKHIGGGGSSSEHSSSSSRRRTTMNNNHSSSKLPIPSSISSSSSSSIIDDSHTTTTTDSSLISKTPSNGIATARIIRVINPKDMIVHRVVHNEEDDNHLTSSYLNFQPKHSQILSQNNIHQPPPKQYYNGISNERSQSYSVAVEKHREVQPTYGKNEKN
jgi:hypothetical protein